MSNFCRNISHLHSFISEEKEDFGTIRIRGRLTEERILPSEYYQPLLKVLMDSVSPEVVSFPYLIYYNIVFP